MKISLNYRHPEEVNVVKTQSYDKKTLSHAHHFL